MTPQAPAILGIPIDFILFGLTLLCVAVIKQGGYDWGFLAYAVGFGGSIIWFGSSSGVALSSMYPEAKSVVKWLRHGWYIIVAYLVGFYVMLGALGWRPDTAHRRVEPLQVSQAYP
jgi:Na+/H+ antiporter NhaD/arsenite permease-like protein